MYWYRQGELDTIEQISASVGTDEVQITAPFSESKYTMTRPDVEHSNLQIKGLEAQDSGVYYCVSTGTVLCLRPMYQQ